MFSSRACELVSVEMKHMILSRVIALLILWIPAAYLFHLLMLHNIHEKFAMSGDELKAYYQREAGYLTSPMTTSITAILGLLFVVFFYELVAYVVLSTLQRFSEEY